MDPLAKRTRILVIEDDPKIRELLDVYLTDQGYDVAFSDNGLEGLDDVKEIHPDLVLLDLRLPGRPGEEVCKAIREDENERIRHTPILMMTGKTSDVDRVIGMVIGATGYLTKPFRLDVLVREIKRCLRFSAGAGSPAF